MTRIKFTEKEKKHLDEQARCGRREYQLYKEGKPSTWGGPKEKFFKKTPQRWAWLNKPKLTGEKAALEKMMELDAFYGKHGKYPSKYPSSNSEDLEESKLYNWMHSRRYDYEKAGLYPSLVAYKVQHLPKDWYLKIDVVAKHLARVKELDAFYGKQGRFPNSKLDGAQGLSSWLQNFRTRVTRSGIPKEIARYKAKHLPKNWFSFKDREAIALARLASLDLWYKKHGKWPSQRGEGEEADLGLCLQRMRKAWVDKDVESRQCGSVFYPSFLEYTPKHMPTNWYTRTDFAQLAVDTLAVLDAWYGKHKSYPSKDRKAGFSKEEQALAAWLIGARRSYLHSIGEPTSKERGNKWYPELLAYKVRHLPEDWYLRPDKRAEAFIMLKAVDAWYGEHGKYPRASKDPKRAREFELREWLQYRRKAHTRKGKRSPDVLDYKCVQDYRPEHMPKDWYKVDDPKKRDREILKELDAWYGEHGDYPACRAGDLAYRLYSWMSRIRREKPEKNKHLKTFKIKNLPKNWYDPVKLSERALRKAEDLDAWYGKHARYPRYDSGTKEERRLGRWLYTARNNIYKEVRGWKPRHLPKGWFEKQKRFVGRKTKKSALDRNGT